MPKNITGAPVTGDDLFGRDYELRVLWEKLEAGANILMLAPRRVGKTSLMLELARDPKPGWTVFYSDLEGGDHPTDFLAEILARLAAQPNLRSWTESLPFRDEIKSAISRLGSIQHEGLRLEIKTLLMGDWQSAARRLEARLAELPSTEGNFLFILDELPILLAHILGNGSGRKDAEILLTWFRRLRQNPALKHVRFLAAGSIGLEGVLRRHNLSAHVNDLSSFQVTAWDTDVARRFLTQLGVDSKFQIPEPTVNLMLDLLGEAIPYHVQLFFDAARNECRGDVRTISDATIQKAFETRLCGPSGAAHLDHYASRLETIFSDDDHHLARELLRRACKSEAGIPLSEAKDLRENQDAFSKVFRQLREDRYLILKSDRVAFASNLVRRWWKENEAYESADT